MDDREDLLDTLRLEAIVAQKQGAALEQFRVSVLAELEKDPSITVQQVLELARYAAGGLVGTAGGLKAVVEKLEAEGTE